MSKMIIKNCTFDASPNDKQIEVAHKAVATIGELARALQSAMEGIKSATTACKIVGAPAVEQASDADVARLVKIIADTLETRALYAKQENNDD